MLHRWGMEFVPSVIAVVMMGMGILPEEGRGWTCLLYGERETTEETDMSDGVKSRHSVGGYGTYLSGRSPATLSCLPLHSLTSLLLTHYPTKKKKIKGYG